MRSKRIVTVIALMMTAAPPTAFAQSTPHVEVGVFAGWTFSDGVQIDTPILALNGNAYDRVDPKDSGSWGFNVGVLTGEHAEFGFIYGQQFSKLQFGGTTDTEIGDLSIKTYHGYFAYNFGEGPVRPFLYGGFGATNFGSVDFSVPRGSGTIGSETQFSTTWGAGVKIIPGGHFGARAAFKMTPTYIKTDSAGWWCDPFWGCYVVGNAQYSNQFEFSGGVIARF